MVDAYLRQNESVDQFFHRCTNLSQFDCSEEEMLTLIMGPKRLPLSQSVPYSVILLFLFLTGSVGNSVVCLVIVRHPGMHTATNYYLFSLALSDLLLLLFGIPNDVFVYWHQYPYVLGDAFCKLRALISEAANYVSVLTIVAFSLERYLAICHPLHMYAMAGLRRAVRIITALWLLALLGALPFAYYTDVNYRDYPPTSGNISAESAFCAMLEMPSWYLCELSSLLFFLLPGLIILFLYVRMGLRIRYVMGSSHAHNPGTPGTLDGVNGSIHGEARQAQSRKTILRMLAAVVVAFYVCWAPFHFQRLFFIYGVHYKEYYAINEWLFSNSGFFYYLSATVNPILYNVMSRRYRNAFKETLYCRRKRSDSRYRDHSSFRETTVHHTLDGTNLVRIRSQSHDRRRRVEFRRNSDDATETTTLCGDKRQMDFCRNNKKNLDKGLFLSGLNEANCNNNECARLTDVTDVTDKLADYKDVIIHSDVNGDAVLAENDIKINISIHLHSN